MHELTWPAWLLIIVSTIPWLVITVIYYVAEFDVPVSENADGEPES